MSLGLQLFDHEGDPLGVPRVELTGLEPVRIGRAADAELSFASNKLWRSHASVTWDERTLRWTLENDGPVFLRGERVRRHVLAPGDRLLFHAFELRVDGQASPPPRHPGFEAALTARWDDGTADVYADWLLAQQDALGDWMRDVTPVPARRAADRYARSLLALGEASRLAWRRGFAVHALVGLGQESEEDEHGPPAQHASAVAAAIAAHPLSRFLGELDVDLESFRPMNAPRPDLWSPANALPGVVHALAQVAWPALKVVRFVRWDPAQRAAAMDVGALRARAPSAVLELSAGLSALAR